MQILFLIHAFDHTQIWSFKGMYQENEREDKKMVNNYVAKNAKGRSGRCCKIRAIASWR